MKRILFLLLLALFFPSHRLNSQGTAPVDVYLLTCGPGTEIYSIYGHSALRVVNPADDMDIVYNWGVFDFSTSFFAWKFARGNLNYMLGAYSYDSFLEEYKSEKRWVVSQKINLQPADISTLFSLIAENLKPQNITYRYDFYYDNCSTRIRDLLEKTLGDALVYPPAMPRVKERSFRALAGDYERWYPWLKFGIDIMIGSPGDKKASFREQMFLPIELKNGLSKLTIQRGGQITPLLKNPVTIVDFPSPVLKEKFISSPFFLFTLLLVLLIILAGTLRGRKFNRLLDIFLFAVYSLLALMMIFANFFSLHNELKWNLNIIWLNPFILICLLSLILNRDWQVWFRVTFFLAAGFLAVAAILPQHVNNAFVPLIIILMLRSSVRSGFSWNPLNLPYLTEI